ncbi:2'-5' RNA ligase family protein [Dyadobacter sp. LHD-138]|uniref:2'-5' RNA ligase family protein n=1 Tax=Dyadobacter sp. LHD-138 TaxID=3071413 RepID=UPI0027E0AE3B|nr:2'-5' RNA ligase family protein [Dyadobacter sp. LHD-138]MDQ6481363.1 2'-5' RNA ligase family protein [Dyadobacter sp. LHD-138]
MENQNLYFIAIVLPEELAQHVIEVQQDIAYRFQSQKALKVMPHITLKAPFPLSAADHDDLLQWFSDLSVKVSQFTINLKGFDAFRNPKHPVIYIKPVPNPDLMDLQKVLIRQFYSAFNNTAASGTEASFKPHVTVAYRDLEPEAFNNAWPEFVTKPFSGSFSVNRFQLLQHDRRKWNVIARHDLREIE